MTSAEHNAIASLLTSKWPNQPIPDDNDGRSRHADCRHAGTSQGRTARTRAAPGTPRRAGTWSSTRHCLSSGLAAVDTESREYPGVPTIIDPICREE
ncbi:hypothetical protein [Arthrobacter pigmenti]